MTDLAYVANARMPTRKAHGYQIVQMCDAFVGTDQEVELVVPLRRQPDEEIDVSPADYYDTPCEFTVTYLPCVDLLWLLPRLPNSLAGPVFYLQAATFALVALAYLLVAAPALVYTRSRLVALLCSPVLGDRTVVELHRYPSRAWVAKLLGRALDRSRGLVVITDGLREEWAKVTDAPVSVEPDGVRLDRFEVDVDRDTLRSELDLPGGALVTYTGSLQPWKGVETLVAAADGLDATVVVVGGDEESRGRVREAVRDRVGAVPSNVRFVGHVRPGLVPRYLLASDVLVVPNAGGREISERYTSPLKLFEYMAAGRPIVASDLPSLREVLDEQTAYFAPPGDHEALGETIGRALSDPEAEERAARARERVAGYAWSARAERIVDRFTFSDPKRGDGCTS